MSADYENWVTECKRIQEAIIQEIEEETHSLILKSVLLVL